MRIKAPFHSLSSKDVDLNGFFQEDSVDDQDLWQRIVSTFPVADNYDPDESSIWSTIAQKWHRGFVSMLTSGDVGQLSRFCRNLHAEPLLKGIDQSESLFRKFENEEAVRNNYLLNAHSHLVRLAEAIGLLPLELDSRYRAPENIYLEPSEVANLILKEVGVEVAPPLVGGRRFGLDIGAKSVVTNRDLYAFYLAWRVFRLATESGRAIEDVRVLEIGGGMGRLALYLYRFGFRKITLIDLPQISAIQAYFLGRSLPEAPEFWPSPETFSGDRVSVVFGTDYLESLQKNSFDIAVNSDSMPEMGWAVARKYMNAIVDVCEHGFLSANQEARKPINEGRDTHSVVSSIAQELSQLERKYRFPFWMRAGYVEEYYEIA